MADHSFHHSPDFLEKSVVYQLFLRAFTPEGTLNAAEKLLPHIASTGANLVYLTPIVEADGDKRTEFWSDRQKQSLLNNPRNPYRISDYFRIDPEYGGDDDLLSFVRSAHSLGLRVLLDLVYYHCGPTAKLIAEHPDFVRRDEHGRILTGRWHIPELNFDLPELREYLWGNMEYFIRKFDVDGYRCDACDLVPLDFWEEGRRRIERIKPDVIMIAEAGDTAMLDQRIAFDVNYGIAFPGELHQVLLGRKSADALRSCWEERHARHPGARFLCNFDNHDIANDDYDSRPEATGVSPRATAALAVVMTMDGIPFLYNGQEIGDGRRHSLYANCLYGPALGINWSRAMTQEGAERLEHLRELFHFRKAHAALTRGELIWIDNSVPESIVSYLRRTPEETVFFAANLGTQSHRVKFDLPEKNAGEEITLQSGETILRQL